MGLRPERLSTMNREDFTKTLKVFKSLTGKTMALARQLSEAAIGHFAEHGDLVYAQEFLDAMPKNYLRRVAFLKWLAAFSPIKMEGEKLLKDKRPEAVEFNLDGAKKLPFWDFAPDPEQITFSYDDVIVALHKTV